MLSPRVLSALLLLLLAALLDARSVSRYPRGPVSEHGGQTLERERRSHHGPEGSKDPRHKEKFITHLTGPLYFNPKCRKQFNRLYHNTRDCTVAAYYRRCALLLVRLANSPRCAERCAVTHGYRWTSRCDNKEAEAS